MADLALLSDRLSRLRWQGLQAYVVWFEKAADNQVDTKMDKVISVGMKFINKTRRKKNLNGHMVTTVTCDRFYHLMSF